MIWLQQFLAWIIALLRSWLDRPYKTIAVQILPETLRKKVLYVVEEDGFKEQAAMLCPKCGNHILHMNLLPDERPCWDATQHEDGTLTLHPSVWRQKDCRVHFWFQRGRVRWVEDKVA